MAMPVLQALRCLHGLTQASPHLLQKGVPSSKGPGHVSAGPRCLRSVPARAPPGPPSPAGTWRGPCGSPFPPPARKGTGYSPMWAGRAWGQRVPVPWRSTGCLDTVSQVTRRAGTHLVAIVHNHQVPQAQGSEELEHPRQRRLLRGTTGLRGDCSSPRQPALPPRAPGSCAEGSLASTWGTV